LIFLWICHVGCGWQQFHQRHWRNYEYAHNLPAITQHISHSNMHSEKETKSTIYRRMKIWYKHCALVRVFPVLFVMLTWVIVSFIILPIDPFHFCHPRRVLLLIFVVLGCFPWISNIFKSLWWRLFIGYIWPQLSLFTSISLKILFTFLSRLGFLLYPK